MKIYYHPASTTSRPLVLFANESGIKADFQVVDLFTGEHYQPPFAEGMRGTVVVRGLTDCDNIIDTGLPGAKADFSYDGRYIAFHDARPGGKGAQQIEVVDLEKRTVRTITSSLTGSSLFPSWTRDGRLSFRYDGPDYRGFMMASNVLSAPERPLPPPHKLTMNRTWRDIFPETRPPSEGLTLVTIWGTWSAHSPVALRDLQRAEADFNARGLDVSVLTAAEPASYRSDLDRIRRQNGIALREIPLTPAHFARTEASNQIPSTLVFRDGKLIDRRLGPQSYDDLRAWVGELTRRG